MPVTGLLYLNFLDPLGHSRPVTGLIYLNFLGPSGPLHACNGTALPFTVILYIVLSESGRRTLSREPVLDLRERMYEELQRMRCFLIVTLQTCSCEGLD
jgi:hypothetical protein